MTGFLYFVPDRSAGLSNADIQTIGLGHAFEGGVRQQSVSAGPSGGPGVILADETSVEPARVRYSSGEQTWREAPFGWVGRWNADAIGPRDLLRKASIAGHFVELSDGNQWLCPATRAWGMEDSEIRWCHTLPRSMVLGADRKWTQGDVVPRYRKLWDLGVSWWQSRVASSEAEHQVGETIHVAIDDPFAAAVECLAANYRVGPEEVALLGLFESNSDHRILDALVDLSSLVRLDEELKKKAQSQGSAG